MMYSNLCLNSRVTVPLIPCLNVTYLWRLAVLEGVEAESIVVKFFGIFFFFFQCNSIVGHIISTGGVYSVQYTVHSVHTVQFAN